MDPSLSTAGAHKLFGELYRKQRPAEAQAQVDKVVGETQDVFARIRRIEEIDEGLEKARRRAIETAGGDRRKRGPAGGGRRKGGGGGRGGGAQAKSGSATARKRKEKEKEKGPGFFASIFGSQVSRWGKSNGTLDGGIFAVNYKLSDELLRLFRMDEATIISAIKGFRFALNRGWQVWEPAKYNTAMTAFQFFNEFIKVDATLRTKESPEAWIAETVKMQRFYALLIQFPGYKEFLVKELPEFVGGAKGEAASYGPALEKVGVYIARIDDRKPSLKNSVATFYTVARDSVIPWEEVVHELKVKKPVTSSYRAPEAIMSAIGQKMNSLKSQVRSKQEALKEVEEIFKFDSKGKLNTDFLNEIVIDVVRRVYSESAVNDSVLKSHKLEPHRLLYVVLRDIDFSAVPMFSGSIQTIGDTGHDEIILFKQGLFKRHIDALSVISRDMEQMVKGNSQFHYNFTQFTEDKKKDRSDPPVGPFLENVKQATRAFRALLRDLQTLTQNHEMAKQHGNSSDDKLNRTKVLPVETITVAARFLPYGDREIAASSRFNGRTVEEAMNALVMNLYNYLYIFRDDEFLKKMAGVNTLTEEIRLLKEQLAKMGES